MKTKGNMSHHNKKQHKIISFKPCKEICHNPSKNIWTLYFFVNNTNDIIIRGLGTYVCIQLSLTPQCMQMMLLWQEAYHTCFKVNCTPMNPCFFTILKKCEMLSGICVVVNRSHPMDLLMVLL